MPTVIPDVEDGPEFSKLEATLVTEEIEARPISRDGQHKWRHAEGHEDEVNELNYDYNVDTTCYPFSAIDSLQDMFSGLMYREHLSKHANFDAETSIECLSVDSQGPRWLKLNQNSLSALLRDASERSINVSAISSHQQRESTSSKRRALVFFVPLKNTKRPTSFRCSISMTKQSVDELFSSLQLNPGFLQNLLGRPDYWAPQPRWHEEDGQLLDCDFFCQHPRWNLQAQGAPLSVYMKYDVQRDLTVYLISHKPSDKAVLALKKQLTTLTYHGAQHHVSNILLDSPLDLHTTICNLNFETSKWHVEKFRRFQWNVVNEVDNHLAGIEQRDRRKLAVWLKNIQIMAQSVDSHLANAQVFLYTARGIHDMASRLKVSHKGRLRQRTIDMTSHLITSMEKQHMWFLNYRGRKDVVMNMIFHFNTQEDALNSIELAADMKKDSTSMTSIALLTMVFLPGTFIASVLSAGIFESTPSMTSFEVTGLWWLWIVTTVPVTLITIACWYWWKQRKQAENAKRPVSSLKKKVAENMLWGGRFTQGLDPVMEQYNASLPYDRLFYAQDIAGSIAFARANKNNGILTADEFAAIEKGFVQIKEEWANNTFEVKANDEDIHTANERRLSEIIGKDIGGKLHTGRSRNEQVATDMRLWLRDQLHILEGYLKQLIKTSVQRAEAEIDVLMPGYTHLQKAQPIRWSHFILGHATAFSQELERLREVIKRVNRSPLGCGALAGNPFNIDRDAMAKELGFEGLLPNSLNAVGDRDFVFETLQWGSSLMLKLSRWAEDLIIYSSLEFGFVRLADAYSTGSSLMPQKKNADSLELIRGKSGRAFGHMAGLYVTIKGLPTTYNKDLQESVEPLIDHIKTVGDSLQIATGVISTLTINKEKMYAALAPEMLATEFADYLVRKGVPFREGHHISGRVVAAAEQNDVPMDKLSLEQLKAIDSRLGDDVVECLDYERAVELKNATGGTSKSACLEQIAIMKQAL
ncbi:argininosuccinate lyase [Stagonosporopsis vannaccii]|nr:argininosuccinate lyase [Stagonosporopsis vannaccii]